MSERRWTEEQRCAIDAQSGALLVSAAAGSGKTSVLTERVIRKLTDEHDEYRIKPEELLVVTFTNAAATEMRARIYKRINELIKDKPEDASLASLRMRLELAEICTIDSFCGKLVRENFHESGISPDFRLLDRSESSVLNSEVLKLTVEELHSHGTEHFTALCDMFANGRDDSNLLQCIGKLWEYSYAHPFPSAWLDELVGYYTDEAPQNTIWGKLILENACDTLNYCISLTNDSLELVKTDAQSEKAYAEALSIDILYFENTAKLLAEGNWDDAVARVASFKKARLKPLKNSELDDIKQAVKIRRDKTDKIIGKLSKTLCASTEEHLEDMQALRPIVGELVSAVKLFSQRLYEAKQEINAYDFSDISAAALALLVEKCEGGYNRTELAKRLCDGYKEIMIDEYQDTNEAQDMLFECLSRDGENLFTVGDVKQSIYGFRLAMPEIFNRKASEYPYYDGSAKKSKIILGKNFRSRAGVLQAVNTMFSRIMSVKAGEMEYTEDERLYCGREDKPSDEPDVLVRVLNMPDMKHVEERRECEADYAARLIKGYIESGAKIPNSDGTQRNVKAGDFCILMRSTKSNGAIYAAALENNGLRCMTESYADFFETKEISVILALLRCADNPTREVELLTVMLSPVFGFTPDEIAEIRIETRRTGLWRAVCIASDSKPHFKRFVEDMTQLRQLAVALPAGEFIRSVYESTAYIEIAGVSGDSLSVKNNLLLLLKYASDFDARSPGAGLAGFVRYIDSIASDNSKLTAAAPPPGEDAVRIMTIHKSKGLEFPFVIIADTAHAFNYDSLKGSLLISNKVGIGIKRKDRPKLRIFPTLPYTAVQTEQKRALVSEELRVFYVAMTRAREKLIILSSYQDADKVIDSQRLLNVAVGKTDPLCVLNANSAAEWFISGLMPSRDSCATDKINFTVVDISEDEADESEADGFEDEKAIPDADLLEDIRRRAECEYQFKIVSGAPSKRTASDLYADSYNEEYFASSKPAFIFGDSLSPAERGTATHRYLQYCDMQCAARSPESELERLAAEGRLSEREAKAVSLDTVAAFFADDVYRRASASSQIFREKQFTVAAPVTLFEPRLEGIADDEMTVVIGEIDLLFIENDKAVIVDYKTDRVDSAERLTERYSTQLKMYADAVERSLSVPVSECIIYSLHMKQAISISF